MSDRICHTESFTLFTKNDDGFRESKDDCKYLIYSWGGESPQLEHGQVQKPETVYFVSSRSVAQKCIPRS